MRTRVNLLIYQRIFPLSTTNSLDEALNNLDLHGVIMIQGLLVNRALKLLHEQSKEAETAKSNLLVPTKGLIL